jgi:hypothetical protein
VTSRGQRPLAQCTNDYCDAASDAHELIALQQNYLELAMFPWRILRRDLRVSEDLRNLTGSNDHC